MVFVTLEDETGFVNLAFTPQVYTRLLPPRRSTTLFMPSSGGCNGCNESHSILVKRVFDYRDWRRAPAHYWRRKRKQSSPLQMITPELVKPRAFH